MALYHAVLFHHSLPRLAAHVAVHVVVLSCDSHGHKRAERDQRCGKQHTEFQLFHSFLHLIGYFELIGTLVVKSGRVFTSTFGH